MNNLVNNNGSYIRLPTSFILLSEAKTFSNAKKSEERKKQTNI